MGVRPADPSAERVTRVAQPPFEVPRYVAVTAIL